MSRAVVVVVVGIVVVSAVQNGQFGAALVLGAGMLWWARRARRAVTGHTHVGPVSLSARHEAGHMAAARYVGGEVTSARLYRDGSGLVQARVPDNPRAVVTFLLAGAAAAGTDRGAEFDQAAIQEVLDRVPAAERGRVLRKARADTDRIVSAGAEEIARNAALLQERGRL